MNSKDVHNEKKQQKIIMVFPNAAKDTNDDHKWNKINDSKKRELERKMLMIIKIQKMKKRMQNF